MNKLAMVENLLAYCRQHNQVRQLLEALQSERMEQFHQAFGERLPDNVEQLFLAAESSSLSYGSLNTYADYTEKTEARHLKTIRARQNLALSIIAAGVLVLAFAFLPFGLLPSSALQPGVGLFGAFVCFLSAVPGAEILYRRYKVEQCDNAQTLLDTLKLAYLNGDLVGSELMEQTLQQLLKKIAAT
jgi:hypothetical protein